MAGLRVSEKREDSSSIYLLQGALTRENIEALEVIQPEDGDRAVLDLEGVKTFDSFGVVRLLELVLSAEGKMTLRRASPELKAYLLRVPSQPFEGRSAPSKESILAGMGEVLIRAGGGVKHFLALGAEFAYWVGVAPWRGRKIYLNRTIHELCLIGVNALPIVGLISLLMGVILALNAAYQLDRFGAKIFVANLVAVSLTRELGPIITAIIVAGRTGSATAAELGTMIVTEEIDALRVTGIHPTSFLIVPKLLALCLAMPCLVILADVVGIMGGLGISVLALDLEMAQYYDQTRSALVSSDIMVGIIKSVVFGLLIGLTGATMGMRLKGGAEEVGRITTAAVVIAFFLLVLADMIFTMIFTIIGA